MPSEASSCDLTQVKVSTASGGQGLGRAALVLVPAETLFETTKRDSSDIPFVAGPDCHTLVRRLFIEELFVWSAGDMPDLRLGRTLVAVECDRL
jgi:hypothetical protein